MTLAEIKTLLNVPQCEGDETIVIARVKAISDPSFDEASIGWVSDGNLSLLSNLNAGCVIVSHLKYNDAVLLNEKLCFLAVESPRKAFKLMLEKLFSQKTEFGQIHPSAIFEENCFTDKTQVFIGPNVVIEKGCEIGVRVEIGANTVVKSGTIIGDDCKIGSNNTIGGVGFGYELNDEGDYELIPHIGNVVLAKGVEIGNNVCIDRAVLGATFLDENVKVDNLVHIAHGVQIGKNSLIIANSMIAGSVQIGENVWVSPSASIRQKLHIGNRALVGMGAVVVKNIESDTIVAGNPAKPFDKK